MAEVIGIISSVITIVNLAKPTAKFVEALYKIAKDDGSMEDEILSVAEHIESAYETIELARLRLKDNCDRIKAMKHPVSRVAKYIKRGKLKDSIRKLTEYFEHQLKKAEKGLMGSRSSNFRFVNGMKWYLWTNMEMTTIFTTLDRIAMYLSIMGPILELEITTYLLDRAEGEIAGLLKVQVHSLQDQLKQTERAVNKAVRRKGLKKSFGKDFTTELEDCATLLVGLSESMRRTGTVPSEKRARKHGGQRRRRRYSSDQSSTTSRDSRSTSTTESSQQTSDTTDCPSSQTTPIFTEVHMSHTHHAPPIPPILPTPPLPQARQTPNMTQILQAPEETTQTPTSDRYIDIGTPIEGWIRAPEAPNELFSKTTSTIDPRISDNYISIVKANILCLQIQDLEQDDAHHPSQLRQTNSRVGRVIGKVLGIEWRQKRNSKPIMVDFWVTELYSNRMIEQLIFGNEFVKRLRRMSEMEA